MSQDVYKIHFRFREMTLPFYTLIALAVMVAIPLLSYAHAGAAFWPVTVTLLFLALVQLRQYGRIIAGRPAYVLDAEGVWVETQREKVPWARITQAVAYENPATIVLTYPMHQLSAVQKLVPRAWLRPHNRLVLTGARVRESMPQIYLVINAHVSVMRGEGSPPQE